MTHEHHGHSYDHAHGATGDSERRLFWAMLLTGGFMIAEIVGGILSGSLALIADAGHMLTDAASLALAWLAFRAARWPVDDKRSYGYHRFQVLAAFVNGLTLLAIVAWIGVEAIRRLVAPVEVLGKPMLIVAALGLLVNLIAFMVLHRGDRQNLNLRGAVAHVVGDMLGSVAAIAAALVILTTGWTPIDPLLSILVALLILRSGWDIVRRSGHILLEGSPEAMDVTKLRAEMLEAVPEVEDVHHVHAWSLTQERPLLTLHATVRENADHDAVLRAIRRVLRDRFGIGHATVQIENSHCADSHSDFHGGEPCAPGGERR